MILVSGAAGKTGQAVIVALVERGAAVRALVRREAQVALVQTLGVKDVVVGDMAETAVTTKPPKICKRFITFAPTCTLMKLRLAKLPLRLH